MCRARSRLWPWCATGWWTTRRHRRSYVRGDVVYDPLHYLSLLEKKPGGPARTSGSGPSEGIGGAPVNGGAKRDHLGGVRRDRLAAAGLSP